MVMMTVYAKYSKTNIQHYYMISNIIEIIIGMLFMALNPPTFTFHSIIGILILGIFSFGIPQILFARAIKHTTPIEASVLLMLDPILNTLSVIIFIGEWPSFWAMIGSIIVILGVILWCALGSKESNKLPKDNLY